MAVAARRNISPTSGHTTFPTQRGNGDNAAMSATTSCAALVVFALASAVVAQGNADRDSDGDGLSDFAEVHKYRTDPAKADSDGDGVPDGDWRERREYQYTVRTIVQVMRPVTIDYLCDDHQDARVLDETDDYVELEVIHYPFTTVAGSIPADANWRGTAAGMTEWTRPGPTADWTPAMRDALVAALAADGIDVAQLDDRTLVERVSRWLCRRTRPNDSFLAFATAFDAAGKPFVPAELAAALPSDPAEMAQQWQHDISARGMFEQRRRGSCSSTSIYLNGCLRALGIPTRTVLCIPVVDANDARQRTLLARGITHHALHASVTAAIAKQIGAWSSHSFNEVFVGGRWRRLNYDHLGQDIADPHLFGLITHVATFSDWADARMADTIGRRQTLRRYDDRFGGRNPYATLTLRDEFGPHCTLANPPLPPPGARLTAVYWGDGPDVPDDVREWFRRNQAFGLVARIDGLPDLDAVTRFLADTDRSARLTAGGNPPLDVALDSRWQWWKHDHALVVVLFDAADRGRFDPAVTYCFELERATTQPSWCESEPLPVPPRPLGNEHRAR